jgi:O-methyltransferase
VIFLARGFMKEWREKSVMNLMRILAPDFALGKVIGMRRSLVDIISLLVREPSKQSVHFAKLMLMVKPHYSMVTNKNLITLYKLVQKVNAMSLPGAIVECGVWNGGSAAIMGLANEEDRRNRMDRTMWLFDSFEGVPRPGDKDGEQEREGYFVGWNRGHIAMVKRIFARLGVPIEQVNIVRGWFDNTLATAPVEQIAILHVDSDWYDSVKIVLDTFYDRISPGGFIILNDYGAWPGCNRATADFLTAHGLQDILLTQIEPTTGAYFQKPV